MVKEKCIPLRMCAVTRKMLPKTDLIRLVRFENKIVIDNKKKIAGRGVYISKTLEVLQIAKQKKTLNRVFRCNIDDSIYNELEEFINGDRDK